MNPYEVLGIARDATGPEIRRAYRRAAKKNHPDHGGDAAVFRTVQTAYEVLRDSARRATYDETGQVDQPKVKSEEQEFIEELSPILQGVMVKMVERDESIAGIDLVGILRENLVRIATEHELAVKNLETMIGLLNAAEKRFATDDPENLLAGMARSQALKAGAERIEHAAYAKRIRRVATLLKKYKYTYNANSYASSGGMVFTNIRFTG